MTTCRSRGSSPSTSTGPRLAGAGHHAQRPPRFEGARVLHRVGRQHREVDRVALLGALLVEAGEQQQVLDQPAHAGGLVLDAAHGPAHVVRLGDGALPVELGVPADGGERRPQARGWRR
ncbi:hypothetical protein GCM10025868_16760 [Angustibacter aerolatus]|uniref:Uncharacterized protein n=1 Tax=Angustibacter aerolatus TaxID=1162965 RepID=A0ABQ6JE06_9ACTN|nr:hypothetical protein GCM10025868_16760 [Angustibacter aerolatus]